MTEEEKSRMRYELLDNIAHVTKALFHYRIEDTTQIENGIHKYNTMRYTIDEIFKGK